MKNQSTGFKIQIPETKNNFTKVPNQVFSLNLDPYEKIILIYLHSKSADFIHYQKFIGDTLGISRQKVSRAITSLLEKNHLTTVDGGKTFKLMLLGVTRDVTQSNTPQVTLGTGYVTLGTTMLPTVTRDVTHSNTTKKTDIQRLNTKIENKTPLQQPASPTTVVPGVKKEIKSVGDFLSNFNEEQLFQLGRLTFNQFIDNTNYLFQDNEYDLQSSIFRELKSKVNNPIIKKEVLPTTIKDKSISYNSNQSKVKEDVNTSIKKGTLISDLNEVNQDTLDAYDMFEINEQRSSTRYKY